MSELEDTALSPNDAIDARITVILNEKAAMEGDDEFDLCCGDHAWWRPSMIADGFERLLSLSEWDREMKRVLGLAIPFSIEAVSKGIFDTIRVALVAHFLGTESVAAYTIVDLILGLTQEFFGGFALTVASLGSQAVGSKNYKLAGEYVQISVVMFSLFFVPNILVWMFLTDDVVKLFGFNDSTAQIAQSYARFFVFKQWIDGFFEAYGSLLGVIDHERFIVFMSIANELVTTVTVLAFLLTRTIILADVGLIQLTMTLLFFELTAALAQCFGWMKKYSEGMFRTFALRVSVVNRVVVFLVTTDAIALFHVF
jgi:O-antigen/teichoic acid export membrane protein